MAEVGLHGAGIMTRHSRPIPTPTSCTALRLRHRWHWARLGLLYLQDRHVAGDAGASGRRGEIRQHGRAGLEAWTQLANRSANQKERAHRVRPRIVGTACPELLRNRAVRVRLNPVGPVPARWKLHGCLLLRYPARV